MKRFFIFMFLIPCLTFTGCATMILGAQQKIFIESNVPDTKVTIYQEPKSSFNPFVWSVKKLIEPNVVFVSNAPVEANLPRGRFSMIIAEKEGYETDIQFIGVKLGAGYGLYFLNILNLGIGIFVDLNNAMFWSYPKNIEIYLQRENISLNENITNDFNENLEEFKNE
ncbi:MAG: hypothetical protein FWG98_06530 [Candidatus Cloacimonetes bacterium]|nr:hypothetical protein [Candidatus Cloacimonadota bacterium]